MYLCNTEGEISYLTTDLEKEFLILLEKASTFLESPGDRILIIIDGAGMISVMNIYVFTMNNVCF